MDDVLLRQLTRQLKILNFWITLFGTLIVAALITVGVLVYQAISYARDLSNKVEATQQSVRENLDLKQQVCNSDSAGSFIERYSDICS